MPSPIDITASLRRLTQGQREELNAIVPALYDELCRLAHRRLQQERTGHTLNTTGLVHEAYLRLVDIRDVEWQDRAHFLAVASRVMRRILVDSARSRKRQKRGGGALPVPLSQAAEVHVAQDEDLLALDEALGRLEKRNERQCRVIEYRCFGGLTVEETAAALNTSIATVKRDWAVCRAWLNRELGTGGASAPSSPPDTVS